MSEAPLLETPRVFFPPVGGSQKFFWKSLTLVNKGKKLFKETIGSSIFFGCFSGFDAWTKGNHVFP